MTENQAFYGNRVKSLLPGQPSLRYPATMEERKEAARESLTEYLADHLIMLIVTSQKGEASEFLQLTESELAEMAIGELKRVYKI